MVNVKGFQALILAAAIACAISIAACGSSSISPGAASGGGNPAHVAAGVKYSDCMRSHGVPNFTDASAGGGFDIPAGINTQSPAYTAARQTCGRLLPAPVAEHVLSDRARRQLVAAARCMRSHGINIADPSFNGPYITLDVPDQTTIQSPGFKRAEQDCDYPVPRQPAGFPASP